MAYNPGNSNVYVTNFGSNTVSLIDSDTNTVVDTIDVGLEPFEVAHNPDNGKMYVTNFGSNTVSVIKADNPYLNPHEGIFGSGNNINIKVQNNEGDKILAKSGSGDLYSDEIMFQGQSTKQNSKVVS